LNFHREYSIRRVKTQTVGQGEEAKTRTRLQPEKGNNHKDGNERKDWRNASSNHPSNNSGKRLKPTKPSEIQSIRAQKSQLKDQGNTDDTDGLWDLPKSSSLGLVDISQREQFELERQTLRNRISSITHTTPTISQETDWVLLDLANEEGTQSQSRRQAEPSVAGLLDDNQTPSNTMWFAESLGQNFEAKSDELDFKLFGSFFAQGVQTTEPVPHQARNSKTSRLGSLLGIIEPSTEKCVLDTPPEEVLDLDAAAILGDLLDEASDNRSQKQQQVEVPKGLVRISMGSIFSKTSVEKSTHHHHPSEKEVPLIIPESEVMKSLVISPANESHSNVQASINSIPQENPSNTDLLSRLVRASHHPVSHDQIQHPGFSFHSKEPTSSESAKVVLNHQKSGRKGNVNISASSRLQLQKITNNKSIAKTEAQPATDEPKKMTKVDLSALFAGKSIESPKNDKATTAGSRLLGQLKSKSTEAMGEQRIRVIPAMELINE
jgi:hypothetical protein